jgi:hypothetical protein
MKPCERSSAGCWRSFRFSSRRLPRHDAIIEPARPLESGGYQGTRPAEARRLREFAVRRLPNPARRAVGLRFDWPGTFKTLSLFAPMFALSFHQLAGDPRVFSVSFSV